jgi:Na+-translocating ferredoxin:NAD+ oxidoreductase RnfA subunit
VAMEKEEKQAVMAAETDARRRLVIGVGFLVQGFRLFPWLGVNFFLKDGMGVAASSLQILQASANLPMVNKQHLLLPFALSFYTRVLFPLVCPIGKRRHRK